MDTLSKDSGATGIRSRAGPDQAWRWRFWGGLALAVVLGGVVGAALVAVVTRGNSSAAGSTAAAPAAAGRVFGHRCRQQDPPDGGDHFGWQRSERGTGSGEIIRGEGYILTNNHVISVAANGGQDSVLFSDGHSAPATITGRDPKADLAVIKVDGQPSLPVIPFGSSKDVVVGQPVVALGAPRGLSNSVTLGIVSALDRTVQVPGRQRADRAADLGLADRRGYQSPATAAARWSTAPRSWRASAGASIPDPGH